MTQQQLDESNQRCYLVKTVENTWLVHGTKFDVVGKALVVNGEQFFFDVVSALPVDVMEQCELAKNGIVKINDDYNFMANVESRDISEFDYALGCGYTLLDEKYPKQGTYWLMLDDKTVVKGTYAADGIFYQKSWFGLVEKPIRNMIAWKRITFIPSR